MQPARAAGLAGTDPMVPRPFVVTGTSRATADTWTLELAARDGAGLAFRAGQFTMLQAFGVGEVPISISGDPADPSHLTHTVRSVGSVTDAITAVAPGAVLGVRGPFGTGWDVSDGRGGDVLVLAGGIGLAPLRPALMEVAADRAAYGRVVLLYGARTPRDVLFADDLHRWRASNGIEVEVTVDDAPHSWPGRVGVVTQLVPRARVDPGRTLALVCGPEVMMRMAAEALLGQGVPAERIRLSMERTMQCGIGLCGHCQLRELFLCVDGPVLGHHRLAPMLRTAEL